MISCAAHICAFFITKSSRLILIHIYLIHLNCITVPCMVGTLFIHCTFDEHLYWFLFSITINSTVIAYVHASLCTCVSLSAGYIPRNGITGSILYLIAIAKLPFKEVLPT